MLPTIGAWCGRRNPRGAVTHALSLRDGTRAAQPGTGGSPGLGGTRAGGRVMKEPAPSGRAGVKKEMAPSGRTGPSA
ncbi:hypothetical protein GCM10017687_35040 [Streptomyces echinatus]